VVSIESSAFTGWPAATLRDPDSAINSPSAKIARALPCQSFVAVTRTKRAWMPAHSIKKGASPGLGTSALV